DANSIEETLAHRARAAEELEGLAGGEERTAELERELAAVAESLEAKARALSRARQAAAAELERAVGAELGALELKHARFSAALGRLAAKTAERLTPPSGPSGRQRPSVRVAANPGEEGGKLKDAASGGELARLLLALRNALRDADHGRVLLFDEIDAGLGGQTARRVGERLRSLAGKNQV